MTKLTKTITLDQKVLNEIEKLADKADTSFSRYVNDVLKKHVHNNSIPKHITKRYDIEIELDYLNNRDVPFYTDIWGNKIYIKDFDNDENGTITRIGTE